MRRTVNSTAPWFLARMNQEVYCRRENRVIASCPNARRGEACPCMHGVETADALFEPNTAEKDGAS